MTLQQTGNNIVPARGLVWRYKFTTPKMGEEEAHLEHGMFTDVAALSHCISDMPKITCEKTVLKEWVELLLRVFFRTQSLKAKWWGWLGATSSSLRFFFFCHLGFHWPKIKRLKSKTGCLQITFGVCIFTFHIMHGRSKSNRVLLSTIACGLW